MFAVLLILYMMEAQAQNDSTAIRHSVDSINRLLDYAVAHQQAKILEKHYAEDFYFKHGSGNIDSKKSWIQNSIRSDGPAYISRTHDSVNVELHKKIAIVTGTLSVQRSDSLILSAYALRYVRVYVYRNKTWQLLSHNTVHEWDIPAGNK